MEPLKFLTSLLLALATLTGISARSALADDAIISPQGRGEIIDLIAHYGHTFDRRDGKGFANLYTEDGEWLAFPNEAKEPVVSLRGRKEIAAFANDRQENFRKVGIVTKHFMLNTVMEVISPTRVETSSMALITWQRPTMGEPKPVPVQAGYYNHIIVKQKGEWKFRRIEVRTSGAYSPEEVYGEKTLQP